MAQRVENGCRDCRNCTNSPVERFARKSARFYIALSTAGLSELARLFFRRCRGCGHQMSLHGMRPDYYIPQQPTVVGLPGPPSPPPFPIAHPGHASIIHGYYR